MSGIVPSADRERLLATVFNGPPPADTTDDDLLRASEVAEMVSSRTVGNWARKGVIPSFIRPGGHRRSWATQIYELAAKTRSYLPPVEQLQEWQLPADPEEYSEHFLSVSQTQRRSPEFGEY